MLAGGAASRFGGAPKGLESVGGRRILDRVADALTEATGAAFLLVANVPEAVDWLPGARIAADLRPGMGSLGGIHAAVAVAPAPVLCVAWDMPFVPAGLLRALAAGLDGADVVVPESGGRRGVEPLCAAYGPACRAAIESRIDAGDLRAIGFHPLVRVAVLPLEQVREHGDPDTIFFNVNTAGELAEAEDRWRRESSR